MNTFIFKTVRQAKRLIIATIGFAVLGIGLAMIVLPGPAFIVIPVGLGILATEFFWARNLLNKVKTKLQKAKGGNSYGKKTE
ncbi:MAG: PGPGW domain-containing protein [Nitrospirota bacterium]